MTTEVIAEALWGNFAQHRCFLSHTVAAGNIPSINDVEKNRAAYEQGYNARIRGKAFISCPYRLSLDPDLWASWRRGWTKADIASDDVAFMRVP